MRSGSRSDRVNDQPVGIDYGGIVARHYRRSVGSTATVLAAMLAISGCGSSSRSISSSSSSSGNSSTSGSAASDEGQPHTLGREPSATTERPPVHLEEYSAAPEEPPAEPQYAGLSVYRRRCSHITRSGALAHIVYVPDVTMTRGSTATVTAAITLNRSVAPEQVLRSPGATETPAIVASCIVDARLTGSEYTFAINDSSWQPRSFLTANTARWTWYVGPKIGGGQALSLEVRPIVSVRYVKNPNSVVSAENANIETYPIKVHVDVPWTERPAELMSRIADTLKVAQGLVETMTGLLVALVGFLTAAGIKRKKATHPKPAV